MAASPLDIIAEVIEREGEAFTDRPGDRGGPTKYGITQASLASWRGVAITRDDVEALERKEAELIYYSRYLTQPSFGEITDARVRGLAVDSAVLHGQGDAVRWLQEAAGLRGDALDGVFGPVSQSAVNGAPNQMNIVRHIVALRCRYIAALVQDAPDQLVNLEGWINRATEFSIN